MDLRYERTEHSLMEACLELGKSKPIRSLTVKEVTQKAQINRITFYSHYSDINELADHIEDLAIQEWLAYLCPVTDYLYNTETFIRKSLRYAHQCRLDGRLMPPFTEAYNNRACEALSRQILA